ncbi:MAG: hypothetical protein PHU59_01875 [Candidatus Omnitrophica bacterium]|nr:hypothetical protein [Candidatus Omnitrophota bacterium]
MQTINRSSLKLKIADLIILMHSRFPRKEITKETEGPLLPDRYNNFTYTGKQKPQIIIEIKIVDKLPEITKTKPIFITYHFEDGLENWRLLKKGKKYIYSSPLMNRENVMIVNDKFDRVTGYLLPKKDTGKVWSISDIIYDFLQVLLINYFAQRNQGIFTHAVGIKDTSKQGLLFAGKSGCGKSTTARIWHKHSKAMVLNDDRIIVRKINEKFFIYGSPWHGDFNDYLITRVESAKLAKLFFIHHAPKNIVNRVSTKQAFGLLYPAIFPTFWDKKCLNNIVLFCHDLISSVPCFSLGFVNKKKVIEFVRKINA